MKRLTAIIAAVLLFAVTAQAQFTNLSSDTRNGKFVWTTTLTSTGIDTNNSDAFTLSKGDEASYATYPIWIQRTLSTTDTAMVTLIIQGSMTSSSTGTWTNVDTIVVDDSTAATVLSSQDLNDKHYFWYRLKGMGATGPAGGKGANQNATETLYIYQPHIK